jgi:hypothetical protein
MQTVTFTSRARFTLTLTGLLLLGIAVPAWPLDTPEARSTLKGIPSIRVIVEDLDPDAERDGLTKDQLQTDVELRLRRAGIMVTSAPLESGGSYLYLNVNVNTKALHPSAPILYYAVNIHLEFHQAVSLRRNPGILIFASTWSVGGVMVVGIQRLRGVRDDVADLVDKFINVYLEQNPKP